MAKHLKLTIKNTQIAEAVNLGSLKDKIAKKKKSSDSEEPALPPTKKTASKKEDVETPDESQIKREEAPPRRARSKSVFAEGAQPHVKPLSPPEPVVEETSDLTVAEEELDVLPMPVKNKTGEELRKHLFGDEEIPTSPQPVAPPMPTPTISAPSEAKAAPAQPQETTEALQQAKEQTKQPEAAVAVNPPVVKPEPKPLAKPKSMPEMRNIQRPLPPPKPPVTPAAPRPAYVKLGPTGRHVKDLLPPPKPPRPPEAAKTEKSQSRDGGGASRQTPRPKPSESSATAAPSAQTDTTSEETGPRKTRGGAPVKDFKDIKPVKRVGEVQKTFDSRDKQGLRDSEEEQRWRKKRPVKGKFFQEELVVRPTSLKIRTPISIKDLASEMKLKASQLVSKMFLQGIVVTLNDLLEDETTIQLLGQEFGCEISIDTAEEKRIQITDKTSEEEIAASNQEDLISVPPVVTFMGHVDHGKTSLIDAIRKTNRAAGEAGAITQHIGAFRCTTAVGDLTILDTPGHEAFSAMRARGAHVTDIVVLVVAGDEGIRQQTVEAIQHALAAQVTVVVAINKADKPGFNPETVYRQLAENNLLPEVWGGQILTVNCSAVTGQGIKELLETLALQAEILELKANPKARARGTVLESQLHKGLGAVATVLVQNGSLRTGDALVFGEHWGRVKTMRDEFGKDVLVAGPSTPVLITGLSGVPDAGQEFIVVSNEREARDIAAVRHQGARLLQMQQRKKLTAENWAQEATPSAKKMLNIVLRADVQGSLEALKVALQKIQSNKAELNIIFAGVGEVSESDIQLASTSKAIVMGFHTKVESHAESLVKQLGVQVRLHDIIYHAVDDVKAIMTALLDKIPQEIDRGKAEVKTLFKSSHTGNIAGCMVIEGSIHRNHHIRVMREGKQAGKAQIASIRRGKEDAREVSKGMECGIALSKYSDVIAGDILEAYEITYLTQEL